MLDLETLGVRPGSVLLAIGAVKFNDKGISDRFYERIDVASSTAVGMVMDPSTVMWWLRQSDSARAEVTKPGKPLAQVLTAFTQWLNSTELEIWGNGAAFDNVLLRAAYDRAKMPHPWVFTKDRCYRTLKSLYPHVPMERTGTHHNALNDAESQALHTIAIMGQII